MKKKMNAIHSSEKKSESYNEFYAYLKEHCLIMSVEEFCNLANDDEYIRKNFLTKSVCLCHNLWRADNMRWNGVVFATIG